MAVKLEETPCRIHKGNLKRGGQLITPLDNVKIVGHARQRAINLASSRYDNDDDNLDIMDRKPR